MLAAPLTGLAWYTLPAGATSGSEPAKVRLDLAPDQSRYNAADGRLRDAAAKLQLALNAEDVKVCPAHACRTKHCSQSAPLSSLRAVAPLTGEGVQDSRDMSWPLLGLQHFVDAVTAGDMECVAGMLDL